MFRVKSLGVYGLRRKGKKIKDRKRGKKTRAGGSRVDCLRFRVRGYGLNLSGE